MARKQKSSKKATPPDKQGKLSFNLSKDLLIGLTMAVIGLVFYLNTTPNGFNMDDHLVMKDHRLASKGISAIPEIFNSYYYSDAQGYAYGYRPVSLSTFALQYSLFGEDSGAAHFINVLLYALTGLLLYLLLAGLFKGNRPLALLVCLLFMVHPLHTEVVASIKNRDELLAFLFALMSWKAALRITEAETQSRKYLAFGLSVLMFMAAMLSKQSILVMAMIIPISLVMFRNVSYRLVFGLASGYALASLFFLNDTITLFWRQWFFDGDGTELGLLFKDWNPLLLPYYLLNPAKRYITQNHGVFYYYQTIMSGIVLAPLMLQFALRNMGKLNREMLANSITGIGQVLRKKKVWIPLAVIAGIGFFIGLSAGMENSKPTEYRSNPTLENETLRFYDLVENPMVHSDDGSAKMATGVYIMGYYLKLMSFPYPLRFYYGYQTIDLMSWGNWRVLLSLLALIAFLAAGFYFAKRNPVISFGAFGLLPALLFISNIPLPIAGMVAERLAYPASLFFLIVLGGIADQFGWLDPWKKTFSWKVGNPAWLIGLGGLGFLCLVYVFNRNAQWKDNFTLFEHDIPHLQESAQANNLLAREYVLRGLDAAQISEMKREYDKAIQAYWTALKISPGFFNARYDLGRTYYMSELYEDCIAQMHICDSLQPGFSGSKSHIGMSYYNLGNGDSALYYLQESLQKDKYNLEAYTMLAALWFNAGVLEKALEVINDGLLYNPNVFEFLLNKGKILGRMDRKPEALQTLETAYQFSNQYRPLVEALVNLTHELGLVEKNQFYLQRLRQLPQ